MYDLEVPSLISSILDLAEIGKKLVHPDNSHEWERVTNDAVERALDTLRTCSKHDPSAHADTAQGSAANTTSERLPRRVMTDLPQALPPGMQPKPREPPSPPEKPSYYNDSDYWNDFSHQWRYRPDADVYTPRHGFTSEP